jgi:hypothetical protein
VPRERVESWFQIPPETATAELKEPDKVTVEYACQVPPDKRTPTAAVEAPVTVTAAFCLQRVVPETETPAVVPEPATVRPLMTPFCVQEAPETDTAAVVATEPVT